MNGTEQAEALAAELRELLDWEISETEKIFARLKAQGRYRIGLDTNSEAFLEVRSQAKRRYREIVEKYRGLLPPGTKIKLW